ncbi:hypothetical protein BEI_2349 [Halomonas beimenensis]|uniref:Uncharacterized protein n=1 Tax=Halomonas beimenensis TaxID=475662 RepID=A0A291P8U0_9GAMM|nr:hypothetical protein BEI_2349 [Halomonas beimenensis]
MSLWLPVLVTMPVMPVLSSRIGFRFRHLSSWWQPIRMMEP